MIDSPIDQPASAVLRAARGDVGWGPGSGEAIPRRRFATGVSENGTPQKVIQQLAVLDVETKGFLWATSF